MTKYTDEGFQEVQITPAMLARAQAKADALGTLRNSIRSGRGNLTGFLGEEVVLAAWPGSEESNTYDYDLLFEEVRFEVKTKDRTVRPCLSYETSVANFNTRQRADFYVFVSLFRDRQSDVFTVGYVCGIISKADYTDQSHFLRKGDIDPSNNFVVRADCHNLAIRQLAR